MKSELLKQTVLLPIFSVNNEVNTKCQKILDLISDLILNWATIFVHNYRQKTLIYINFHIELLAFSLSNYCFPSHFVVKEFKKIQSII